MAPRLISMLVVLLVSTAASAQSPGKSPANADDRTFTRLLHEDVEVEELEAASSPVEGEWTAEQRAALGRDGNLLPELIVVGGTTRRVRDGIALSEEEHQTGVMTPGWYHAPVRIEAVAKTDSTNLRLYFARGMVIYNWEGNPAELRYHDAVTGEQVGVPGKGAVTPDEWVTLAWEVMPDRVRLLVNGEVRYEETGDFTKAAGHVGIGAAWGATVTVRSLRVAGLDERR